MIFKRQAEKAFNVQSIVSPDMEKAINQCADVYHGNPEWLDDEEGIKTINFAKALCSETARLVTLGIGIHLEGSARAEWLQQQIDLIYSKLRDWVEYGCAYGTVFLKPNGTNLDVFTPADVLLVDYDNLGVREIIFKDTYQSGKKWYTRLEHHRFVETEMDGAMLRPYYISNRAYVSKSTDSIGDPIPLTQTKWADMAADTPPILKASGEPLDKPMFGILRTPQANNVDISSPMGLPIFREALEELKDLDIAYSRNAGEIFDSQKIILADDRLLYESGKNIKHRGPADVKGLPHYVKNVFGNDQKEFYQEINPQLNTDTRVKGINNLLSQIGYKAGFANGYFVFNQSSGIQTATGVEADQQRTVQFIKDVRDQLESCLDDTLYALNVYADLYGLAPVGTYDVTYDFGDILYDREADRSRWWQYVMQGKVPAWLYFTKFEGMTKDEAVSMTKEAENTQAKGLFDDE
jgi:A118 family predicted phage portal protein